MGDGDVVARREAEPGRRLWTGANPGHEVRAEEKMCMLAPVSATNTSASLPLISGIVTNSS